MKLFATNFIGRHIAHYKRLNEKNKLHEPNLGLRRLPEAGERLQMWRKEETEPRRGAPRHRRREAGQT